MDPETEVERPPASPAFIKKLRDKLPVPPKSYIVAPTWGYEVEHASKPNSSANSKDAVHVWAPKSYIGTQSRGYEV